MSSIPPPPGPLGPQVNHPRAVASLVCAIVGLMFFGILLGTVAIVLGYQSRNAIRLDPLKFKGDGLARAGLILGIVDVVAYVAIVAGGIGAS